MPGEYRRATSIVGSLGLALIGANGVLLLLAALPATTTVGRASGGLVYTAK